MEERREHDSHVNISDSTIVGTGIVYNKESRMFTTPGGKKVVEIIRQEATEGLLDDPDIRAYHSHQKHMVLGRNGRTLQLRSDDQGTHYEIDMSGDIPTYADDLMKSIKRGDVDTSSFGFMLPDNQKEGVNIYRRDDGVFVREIFRMQKITDISPMATIEAYPSATVSLRGIDEFAKEAEKKGKAYLIELAEMYRELI